MLDDVKPVLAPGFLDCGAHSVETGIWKELPIPEYVEWTCENHSRFRIIAVPDEIGDPEKTKVQTLDFAKRVEGRIPKEKILPIYHMQSKNLKAYLEMLDYASDMGCSWVAIGGALGVGFTPMQKRIALENIFKHLPRDKFKIHLLGITEPDVVQDFAPDSVDSSKYLWEGGNLNILRYSDDLRSRRRWRLPVRESDEILFKAIMDEIWENRHLMRTKFTDRSEMESKLRTIQHSITAILANLMHVVEFERKIRATVNPNFRHYVTANVGFLRAYSGIALEILEECWRDRSLVAFPQFFGKPSNRVMQDLHVFRTTE